MLSGRECRSATSLGLHTREWAEAGGFERAPPRSPIVAWVRTRSGAGASGGPTFPTFASSHSPRRSLSSGCPSTRGPRASQDQDSHCLLPDPARRDQPVGAGGRERSIRTGGLAAPRREGCTSPRRALASGGGDLRDRTDHVRVLRDGGPEAIPREECGQRGLAPGAATGGRAVVSR